MKFIEDSSFELKREYTEDLKKTIVAFGNTHGGTVLIGVDDDSTVVGVKNLDETLLKITNTIKDSIKPDLTGFTQCIVQSQENKEIIRLNIQKGTNPPYYISGKGISPSGVFIRHGASTIPASETAILNMIKETDAQRYENMPSLNQNLTFNELSLEFSRRNIIFEANQMKTLHLLNNSNIYTNLGLLLSDQCQHTIKLAVFQDDNKNSFKDRKEFSGSLLKQLSDCYQFIDMYNKLRSTITGLTREDYRDYPEESIRESLLNALIHRDYSYSSSILISIFPSKIDFVSIGGLPKGISLDDIMIGLSISRNENLANIMYRLNLIEAYGTGIPKILNSYEPPHLKPLLETTTNAFKITLFNRNETSLYKKSELDHGYKVSERHKNSISLDLNLNETKAMIIFKKQDIVYRKDIQNTLECSQAVAVRILKSLLDKNQIRSIGKGRSTSYTIL